MFKNKNKVTKISNGILILMFILSLLSAVSVIGSLMSGNTSAIEGYKVADYWYNGILMIVYVIVVGITVLLLNKKVDLYKDEYPVSKQAFNLFIVLSIVSLVITFFGVIVSYYVYKTFSFYSILSVFIAYLPTYLIAFMYVNKNEYFSKENSKGTNFINFVILYLLMTYTINLILLLLQMIFEKENVGLIIQNIVISLIWIVVVMLANKLIKIKNLKTDKQEDVKLIIKKKNKNNKHE